MSSSNSSYSNKLDSNPFDVFEQEIAKFSEKGHTILMGDLNARTSTFRDSVIDDTSRHIPILNSVLCDKNYVCRNSQYSSMPRCTYGKQLIDLCISTGFKIVNGWIFGDPIGKFTCQVQWQ